MVRVRLGSAPNKEVEVILLSRNKGAAIEASQQFDRSIGVWDEWCLINVMLIKRLHRTGLSERLTIGKQHFMRGRPKAAVKRQFALSDKKCAPGPITSVSAERSFIMSISITMSA